MSTSTHRSPGDRRVVAARRLVLVAVPVLAALGVSGCGGTDAPDGPPVADPAAVARDFRTATGIALQAGREEGTVDLRPRTQVGSRFPSFTLRLPRTSEARSELVQDAGGRALPRGGDGFLRPTPTTVVKDYGRGVLLTATTGDVVDPRFPALDRAVAAAAAGTPSRLPEADRPCSAVGIDPVRGREGSCVLGDQSLTVVDAGTRLDAGTIRARLVGVAQTSVIPSRGSGYGTYRTRGRVVVVVYRLTNTGDEAIDDPIQPGLVVGGRRYGEGEGEDTPSIFLDAYRPRAFPLQPGATVKLAAAIRVSRPVAAQVGSTGQLELPASGPERPFDTDARIGRIRLAGAARVGIDEGQLATR